ncbi:DNA replication protein [Serratia sp. JSRIV006]|uniref:DNA replication protein n=1 Tax=Serratia sp. JSRIV006 TaxID=2831896 RepID=UPI001CC02C0F|nr:DNA replication protein [Serratia sp. JSRIV006]UAN64273.1 DNA replication protein [Serratia sp. JSRIV006]
MNVVRKLSDYRPQERPVETPEATGKGFALIHRQFMDSRLYKDSQAVHLWLHLILKANYSPAVVKTDIGEMMVGRGQMITGRPTLVSETFIPDNKVKSLLRSFESKGMLKVEAMGRKFSLITILKYDDFQAQNCPTNVQQLSNANISNNEPLSGVCPTNVQQLSINNNITNNSLSKDKESVSAVENSEQKKPSHTCQDVIDAYHRILPECPSIRALSDKRKNLIKTFWVKAGKITRQLDNAPFSMAAWEAYLTYISLNCRWMLGTRPDSKTGKTWRCKNLEYLLSDEVYLKVREGNSDDV